MILSCLSIPKSLLRRTSLCCLNLACAHAFHDWILQQQPNAIIRSDEFLGLLRQSSVSRIGFLRHGNTLPSETGKKDFDRLLSDKGRDQVKEAGRSFGAGLMPFFPYLLVSPSPRTVETAEIFLNAAGVTDGDVRLKPVPSLYDGTVQPEGSAVFRKIGYAPLRDYVGEDGDDVTGDRATMRKLLSEYATDVVQAIVELLRDKNGISGAQMGRRSDEGTTLWIVSHAIYLPSAVLGVALLAHCDAASLDVVLSTSTREAEGYLVSIKEASVQYLSRYDF